MLIGIFTKMDGLAGTEHRAIEMANAIVRYTNHECTLFCERGITQYMLSKADPNVKIAIETFGERGISANQLYQLDSLLVINSDIHEFSQLTYWQGRTDRHRFSIEINKIPQVIFLYNSILDPASKLHEIAAVCPNTRIICANKEMSNILSTDKKYSEIRFLPRLILESPIDPHTGNYQKNPYNKIRIGRHTNCQSYKFNEDHVKLIKMVNETYGYQVIWDFMGVPSNREKELSQFKNVIIRKPFSTNVPDYFRDIDIYLQFINYTYNEPWSRGVAEAMRCGCPVLATNRGGHRDQIIQGNTGYLCDTLDDFYKHLVGLLDNPQIIHVLGFNAHIHAKQFLSINIIGKYLDFITSK
jgi:glycosyltransferase involved in cell wall biosynthesis